MRKTQGRLINQLEVSKKASSELNLNCGRTFQADANAKAQWLEEPTTQGDEKQISETGAGEGQKARSGRASCQKVGTTEGLWKVHTGGKEEDGLEEGDLE